MHADAFVRTIPAVTPEIEEALNSDASKALFASAKSARNTTNRTLTHECRVFEMVI